MALRAGEEKIADPSPAIAATCAKPSDDLNEQSGRQLTKTHATGFLPGTGMVQACD